MHHCQKGSLPVKPHHKRRIPAWYNELFYCSPHKYTSPLLPCQAILLSHLLFVWTKIYFFFRKDALWEI